MSDGLRFTFCGDGIVNRDEVCDDGDNRLNIGPAIKPVLQFGNAGKDRGLNLVIARPVGDSRIRQILALGSIMRAG